MSSTTQVRINIPIGTPFRLNGRTMGQATRFVAGPLAERSSVDADISRGIMFWPTPGKRSGADNFGGDQMALQFTGAELDLNNGKVLDVIHDHAEIPVLLLPENVREALFDLKKRNAMIGLSFKWFGVISGAIDTWVLTEYHSPVSNWASLFIDGPANKALLRFEYVFRMGDSLFSASLVNAVNGGLLITYRSSTISIEGHNIREGDTEEDFDLGDRVAVKDELSGYANHARKIGITYRTFVGGVNLMPHQLRLPFSVVLPQGLRRGPFSGLFFRGRHLTEGGPETGAILDLRPEVFQAVVKNGSDRE